MLRLWPHHLAAVVLLLSLLLPAYAQNTAQPSSTVDAPADPPLSSTTILPSRNPFDLDNDSDSDPSITTLRAQLDSNCTAMPALSRACTACGLSDQAFFYAYTAAWSTSCSGSGIGADVDGCKRCEPGGGYEELDRMVDAGCAKMVFITWKGRRDARAAERLCLSGGGEMRVVVVEEALVEAGTEEVEAEVETEETRVPKKGIFLPGEEIPPEAMEGAAVALSAGWWVVVAAASMVVWMGVME